MYKNKILNGIKITVTNEMCRQVFKLIALGVVISQTVSQVVRCGDGTLARRASCSESPGPS